MNKYEKLIEYIINDDEDRARALFHEIVVEKSREIYENIMDEEIGGDPAEELVDEIAAEEEGLGEAEDNMDAEDAMGDMDVEGLEDEEGDMEDMDMDMDADEEHEEHNEELEDRVMDLESALDELKSEFDALMADEKDEPEHADMFGDESEDNGAMVREYVEKVSEGHGAEKKGAAEGHEAGKGSSVAVNKDSPVAKKNDMGGTTANIAKGGAEQAPDGTSPKKAANYGTKGETKMPHAGSFENVPGAKAGGAFK